MVSMGRMEIILDMVPTDKSENFEEGKVPRQQIASLEKRSNSYFRKKA